MILAVVASLSLGTVLAAKPGSSDDGSGSSSTLPSDMSALGDSITRAYNVDGTNFGEHPEHSWSTGYCSRDIVSSHYERLLSQNRAIKDQNHNDAVNGAKMVDLAGQADVAVSRGADYVTVQMGGNDLCTSSLETMTSTADYRARFRAAAD